MRWILGFLGNPGKDYARTRHNIGWMVCDALSASSYIVTTPTWRQKFKADIAEVAISPAPGRPAVPALFVRPQLFMNQSGQSIQAASAFYQNPAGTILIVHDDLELPFGSVRIQQGGGLGGHNGLRSIAERLGDRSFHRVRFGIGRPERQTPASYVLCRFDPIEEQTLPDLLLMTSQRIADYLGSVSQEVPKHR